jgi:murein DD-endopeptidase MepM/ murein hydrolase activator NlpD
VLVYRWFMSAFAVLLSLALAVPASADPNDDKARLDRQLDAASAHLEAATERAQQAAADYAAAVSALPGAQSAVADAEGRVAAAEVNVREAGRHVDAARTVREEADRKYAAAGADVAHAREEVGRLAATIYKGGDLLLLDSIVTAGSPEVFAERMGYLDHVAAHRKGVLDGLVAARAVLRQEQAATAAAHRRAEDAEDTARQALTRSQAAADEANRARDRVQALVDQRQAAVDVANAERGAVLAKYEELKAESARVEQELRAVDARPSGGPRVPVPSGGGFFAMPVAGHKSSNFGMRFHPLFHSWILHSGLDIGAGSGQPILAAADGEVVKAGWSGGYGNYTCVAHGQYQGKGIATCYGHQSAILVGVGQQVRRGQVIGRVGTTGNSTGPHLHFEVRIGGSPVDPEKWLPGCLC